MAVTGWRIYGLVQPYRSFEKESSMSSLQGRNQTYVRPIMLVEQSHQVLGVSVASISTICRKNCQDAPQCG